MRAPLLSVRDLRTHYFTDEGLVRAVDGVSFEVGAGRVVGIVGESGCGKSATALSLLHVVPKPGRVVGGEILLDLPEGQVDIARLDPAGKQIRAIRGAAVSLVFQEPMTSFSPSHSIGNQIIEAIRLHLRLDREAARRRAIEMLTQVGIPDAERRIDSYAFQLSGGMRQRAMIAMALACDPLLLIADEPTTALDVTTQAQILALLRRLQSERGLAILLITHNLGVVAQMADEVVVMYLGKVVERGPVDDIFHAPKHPYTRALLRSMPSIASTPRTLLPTIAGAIPHAYSRPPGCPFHPRCPEMMPGRCDRELPGTNYALNGHQVSCLLYEQQALDAGSDA